jgi:hypothetical protein
MSTFTLLVATRVATLTACSIAGLVPTTTGSRE